MLKPETDTRKFLRPESISIVMPAYNEEAIIAEVIADHTMHICDHFDQSEFIIVNDCSTDRTKNVLADCQRKFPKLKVIDNSKNSGHGASLLRAMNAANGDLVFQNDSDNQFFPEDFWRLYDDLKVRGSDMTIGCRGERHDAVHRKIVSGLGKAFIFLTSGFWIKDSNSPFRLYRKNALSRILPVVNQLSPFFPSILMVICAKKFRMNVGEVDIRHKARLTGTTFIRSFKILKLCYTAISEVLKLWRIKV